MPNGTKTKPTWYAKEWLKFKGLKQADVIRATGHSKSEVSEWVSGDRRYNTDVLQEFAEVIGVEPADLLRPPVPSAEPLLVGKVGAGAEIVRPDEGVVLEAAGRLASSPNVAVIEGDSQYPLLDRWRVHYGQEHQGVLPECIGKMCVVQVTDGPTLLKTLKRGSKKGLWRLESWNAPARDDVRLDWAALVTAIEPR